MNEMPGIVGYSVIAGSHLYGVNTPESDRDFRGFYDAPEINLSRSERNPVVEWKEEGREFVYYSLRHYLSLLEKASPNTIELLFVPLMQIKDFSEVALEINRNFRLFVTKQAVKNMLAMAKGQYENFRQDYGRVTQYVGHGDKINFKPVYHALRLTEQVVMLKTWGDIRYPLEEVVCEKLKKIREGKYTYEEVNELFFQSMDFAERLEYTVDLPESCDPEKVDELYYRLIAPSVSEFLKKMR